MRTAVSFADLVRDDDPAAMSATAWALAKMIKGLPLDTAQEAVFRLANAQVKLHKKHSKNQEIY